MDPDSDATTLYELAGFDPTSPTLVLALARAVVRLVPDHGPARLVRSVRGAITVPLHLPDAALQFEVARELARWFLLVHAEEDEPSLDALHRLAAAIVAPAPAFRRAASRGRKLPRLARLFCCTESLVALRLGEVLGVEVALVSPSSVRWRGPARALPREAHEARRLAETERPPPAGVDRVRLSDDPRRVALVG